MKTSVYFSIFVMIVFSSIGCSNKTKSSPPSKEFDINLENLRLVRVIDNRFKAKDVWGNALMVDRYYAYTQTGQMLPVSYRRNPMIPNTFMSIEEYLSSLRSMGNLKSDTVLEPFHINAPTSWVKVVIEIYNIRNLSLDAKLN